MTVNVYSVGQINSYIKNLFTQDILLKRLYVRGEVSNITYHRSGHIYFTLKDATGVISAVMFASSVRTGLKFQMRDGDKVVVHGSVRIYEAAGKYQLYAEAIQPEGQGDLHKRFEELKKELMEMGMFDEIYKQPIPKYPKRIGIVTAPTGAAIRDIQQISRRRNPFVQTILYPALVQGDGAAQSIVQGIEALDAMGVDVIIVGRGGGSLEDLWAFNEEIVARAIFNCKTPIISAVGHETDTTIADYVADKRASTPSAAAELAVVNITDILNDIANKRLILNKDISRRLDKAHYRLDNYKLKLERVSPQAKLDNKRQLAADYLDDITDRMNYLLQQRRHQLEKYAIALDANSPLKKISGGYAYVANEDGKSVRSVGDIKSGDKITGYLKDGKFKATIDEIL